MFTTKLLYFFTFCIYGMVLPYLPLLLRNRGLGDAEISFVGGALGASALVAPLLIAHFADRKWRIGDILRAELALAATCSIGWLFARGPLPLFLVTFCFFACYLPALGLLDAHTLRTLGNEARAKFQGVRIWGSAGFILPGLLCALAEPADSNLAVFCCSTVFVAATVALYLSFPLRDYESPASASKLPSITALRAAFSAPLWKLLWPAALACLGMAIYYSFYPLYLRGLGLSNGQTGVIYNLGVVAEMLLMPLTGRLIARFGSRRVIAVGIIAVLIRSLALASSNSIWIATLSQILHGPVVVGFFVTLPIVLQEHADDSYRYSLQGLYVMIFLGVVRLLGPWLAGILLVATGAQAQAGLQTAFLLAAGCSAAGLLLYLATRSPASAQLAVSPNS